MYRYIDTNLHEAVYASLIHVHKKLCVNGIAVIEDAGHAPLLLGAKLALVEFLDFVGKDKYHSIQMESGQYVLIKRLNVYYSLNPPALSSLIIHYFPVILALNIIITIE